MVFSSELWVSQRFGTYQWLRNFDIMGDIPIPGYPHLRRRRGDFCFPS